MLCGPGSPASGTLRLCDGEVVVPSPEVSAAVKVVRDGLNEPLTVDVHSAGDGRRVVRQEVLVGRDRRPWRLQLGVALLVVRHRRGRLGRLDVLMGWRRRRSLSKPPCKGENNLKLEPPNEY